MLLSNNHILWSHKKCPNPTINQFPVHSKWVPLLGELCIIERLHEFWVAHAPSSTMHIGGRSFIIHQRRVGVSYSTLAIICQKLLACPRTPLFWQTCNYKVLCPCMGPLSTRLQYTLSSNVLITVYSTHLHVPTMPCRHAMFSKSNH